MLTYYVYALLFPKLCALPGTFIIFFEIDSRSYFKNNFWSNLCLEAAHYVPYNPVVPRGCRVLNCQMQKIRIKKLSAPITYIRRPFFVNTLSLFA